MLLKLLILFSIEVQAGYFDLQCSRTHAKLTLNTDTFSSSSKDPSFDSDLVGLYLNSERKMPENITEDCKLENNMEFAYNSSCLHNSTTSSAPVYSGFIIQYGVVDDSYIYISIDEDIECNEDSWDNYVHPDNAIQSKSEVQSSSLKANGTFELTPVFNLTITGGDGLGEKMTVTATNPYDYNLIIDKCDVLLQSKDFTIIENRKMTSVGLAFGGKMLSEDSFEFRRFSISMNVVDSIDVACDVTFKK
ncbi:Oidioi.mRNA.OKI2018_I69.chr2.g5017.t1.cds [Oikopleura dioica]|uniref:Oidioi.mRNA.OKI2018_I69.chr2.g5017.t1.cds n=1 Tax=Oikopleura dioica TaxID=34765 RepID=A0ABN7T2X2_OIKDI|nr:Oidioi.mRNA.OKI2018_I69.chr2.g5017.t1.cds [Oikopleura dioica]